MKTFQWINLIGILCIIFGAQAIINGVMLFVMTGASNWAITQEQGGTGPQPVWLTISVYFGILVSILYLVAGVSFLKKKAFSLRLMYTALILNLLARFVPMLMIGFHTAVFPWQLFNIFSLMGPMIDVLLLIGVYQVSRYYYTDPDKYIYFLGAGTLSPSTLKLLSLIGSLVFLIPLFIFVLWFYVSSLDLSYPENVAKFHSYLPPFLHTRFGSAYLSLFCGASAFIFSSIGLKLAEKGWRKLNQAVMISSMLLFLLILFTLM
ncbi:MAG: hypothetical protein Q7T20_01455 [Saprospiraceae bacterium]|nr:hypothetical protein [Saprospiraceae bacterium]